MARTTPTKPSTPRLSEAARHLVYPESIAASGWPRIERRLEDMEISFDPWQQGAARLVLGKDKKGRYAATVGGVVWSIPRQVGKTFTIGSLIIALCIEYPGTRVLWTAHRVKTATDGFRSMQGMVKRPKVAPHLAPTRTDGIKAGHADQEIMFRNGSMIMFGARADGFGRGFTNIDFEVFDEAQILEARALDDMVAATNQSRHPHGALLFFIGTPPRPVDGARGDFFREKRERALSGKSSNLVYLEFSADPESDLDDRSQWPIMNPSYPARTPAESIERLRENLPDDDAWNREGRGVWDRVTQRGVIPFDAWSDRRDEHSAATDRLALGIEVGPDLAWASVALAGQRDDGDWHVELDESRQGAAWLDAYVASLVEANPSIRSVAVDVSGPVSALLEQHAGGWRFRGSKVRVQAITVKEIGSSCSRLIEGVVTGWLHHIGQPQLDLAVQVAGKRALRDTGMWVFSRRSASTDITPVQASNLALWGAQNDKAKRPSPRRARGGGGVMIL